MGVIMNQLLDSKDKELIKSIIDVENNLLNIYMSRLTYELINYMLDQNSITDIGEEIKKILILEQKLLKCLDCDKLEAIYDEFKRLLKNIPEKSINDIIKNTSNNVIICRINNHLADLFTINKSKKRNEELLKLSIELDFVRTEIGILEQYSKLYKKDLELLENIVKHKIITMFIYSDIEEEMIDNNFMVGDTINWNSKFSAEILKIPYEQFYLMKSKMASRRCENSILEIVNLKEDISQNKIEFSDLLYKLASIRAALLFIDEEKRFKKQIFRGVFVNIEGELPKDDEKMHLLNEALNSFKSDRKLIRILSKNPNS